MQFIHIIGGGTYSHVRNHLALCAPAFGATARHLDALFEDACASEQTLSPLVPILHLTKMASPTSHMVTNDDVDSLLSAILAEPQTKVIILNAALCDFDADVVDFIGINALMPTGERGAHGTRLKSRETRKLYHPLGGDPIEVPKKPLLQLTPARKIVNTIRNGQRGRKDVFLVAFKTTTGATEQEQYLAGLYLLKEASCNLVLANDTVTRRNMIIVPEEARYHVTTDREEVLQGLVEMVLARSNLHFTRSTVVGSEADLVAWDDPRVPANLRTVVDHAVSRGAYQAFRGKTAGHFAVNMGNGQFLTSRRKTNFNEDRRLVWVESEDDSRVIAHGARPSVGGQSQRIVFREHPDYDCIFHAHVPLRENHPDPIQVQDQRPFECGSHECGQNTSNGLRPQGRGVKAVMLDNHGPNVVFTRDTPAEEVIAFIERNFDLTRKTGGDVSP